MPSEATLALRELDEAKIRLNTAKWNFRAAAAAMGLFAGTWIGLIFAFITQMIAPADWLVAPVLLSLGSGFWLAGALSYRIDCAKKVRQRRYAYEDVLEEEVNKQLGM